jgi:hypothetical protein
MKEPGLTDQQPIPMAISEPLIGEAVLLRVFVDPGPGCWLSGEVRWQR